MAMENQHINSIYIKAVRELYTDNIAYVKLGNNISKEIKISKGLRQGCCIAPTLFKIYLGEALKNWKIKCERMGIKLNDDMLYSLNFADDQVIFAENEYDAHYTLRKLNEEYEKWGLKINFKKTEYMVVGGTGKDLVMEDGSVVKCCQTYKYLGTILTDQGGSEEEIKHRIRQGKSAIRQLHSIIWNKNIANKVKIRIYKTIVESISLYGAELWEISKNNEKKLKAMEMEFWRRSYCVTLMDRIRNENIKQQMGVTSDIMDTIEGRRLKWYGHLRRMPEERWPLKTWRWQVPMHRKRGRPKLTWYDGVRQTMRDRHIEDDDW